MKGKKWKLLTRSDLLTSLYPFCDFHFSETLTHDSPPTTSEPEPMVENVADILAQVSPLYTQNQAPLFPSSAKKLKTTSPLDILSSRSGTQNVLALHVKRHEATAG